MRVWSLEMKYPCGIGKLLEFFPRVRYVSLWAHLDVNEIIYLFTSIYLLNSFVISAFHVDFFFITWLFELTWTWTTFSWVEADMHMFIYQLISLSIYAVITLISFLINWFICYLTYEWIRFSYMIMKEFIC